MVNRRLEELSVFSCCCRCRRDCLLLRHMIVCRKTKDNQNRSNVNVKCYEYLAVA